MADCDYLESCSFFKKVPPTSSLGTLIVRNFCQGTPPSCARYQVGQALGRQNIPDDLDPMMQSRAQMIIKQNQ